MDDPHVNRHGWAWSIFTVRWVLGLIFFMAGWWKCFELGPAEHARSFFVGGFAETWIPAWLLWSLGTAIPVVELVAGGLVCLGLARRAAYLALGAILVTVTYGHLLLEPLFDTTSHIFPRLCLLVFVWVGAGERDRYALDTVIAAARQTRSPRGTRSGASSSSSSPAPRSGGGDAPARAPGG